MLVYVCVYMCVHECVHVYMCALLLHKTRDLFFLFHLRILFFNPLNLGFVVAIIPSTETGPNNDFFFSSAESFWSIL